MRDGPILGSLELRERNTRTRSIDKPIQVTGKTLQEFIFSLPVISEKVTYDKSFLTKNIRTSYPPIVKARGVWLWFED